MKELQPHKIDPTEINAVKPDKREKIIYSIKLQPGQKAWQLNLKTKIIKEALYEQTNAEIVDARDINTGRVIGKDIKVVRKLVIEENCLYCAAINAQNADVKFMKMIGRPAKRQKKLKTL